MIKIKTPTKIHHVIFKLSRNNLNSLKTFLNYTNLKLGLGTRIVGWKTVAQQYVEMQVSQRYHGYRTQHSRELKRVLVRNLLPLGGIVWTVGVGSVEGRVTSIEGQDLASIQQEIVERQVDGAPDARGKPGVGVSVVDAGVVVGANLQSQDGVGAWNQVAALQGGQPCRHHRPDGPGVGGDVVNLDRTINHAAEEDDVAVGSWCHARRASCCVGWHHDVGPDLCDGVEDLRLVVVHDVDAVAGAQERLPIVRSVGAGIGGVP